MIIQTDKATQMISGQQKKRVSPYALSPINKNKQITQFSELRKISRLTRVTPINSLLFHKKNEENSKYDTNEEQFDKMPQIPSPNKKQLMYRATFHYPRQSQLTKHIKLGRESPVEKFNVDKKIYQARDKRNMNYTSLDWKKQQNKREFIISPPINHHINNRIKFKDIVSEDHQNYLNKYAIEKQIGKGVFGVVYLARELKDNQKVVAIKVYEKFKMNKDPSKFKNIRKEINTMQNLDHQGIIKLIETVDTLTKINLVIQYGGDQSLLQYIKSNYPVPESQCQIVGKQLLEAIDYLHKKSLAHRDIKIHNILISKKLNEKGNLEIKTKLIDFGFSTITNKSRKLNALCGTPNYMAPQLISRKQYFGQQVDVWAYGIVMYTLREGRHPFKAQNINQLQRLIKKGVYGFRKIQDQKYKSFIKKILKKDGSERPSAAELLQDSFLSVD